MLHYEDYISHAKEVCAWQASDDVGATMDGAMRSRDRPARGLHCPRALAPQR